MREWAERPKTTRIRGGESPIEIIETGKIAIDNAGRKFLVGAGQSLGSLLAPSVKVVEVLPGQLRSKKRVVGEYHFAAALDGAGWTVVGQYATFLYQ